MDNCDKCQDAIKLWVRTEYGSAIERLTRLEQKHEGSLRALDLQAAEYERRLDALNHAHTKHERFASSFLSESLFRAYKDSIAIEIKQVNKELAELRGNTSGRSSARHLVFEVATLFVAAIAIAVSIYAVTT